MNLEAGLTTLDPAFARDQSAWWMTAQVFNGLVELDSNLNVQPSLAHRWEISEDGKIYTFYLRQGIRFQEDVSFGGKARTVTAGDVLYSFERIRNPATASTGRWVFEGKVATMSAPNDSTFVLTLTEPFPPMLGLLTMPYGFVVPREAVEHYGADFRNHPVGTGPFRFFRWEEGEKLVLHRNPTYWESTERQPIPALDAVVVSFIPSRLSAYVAFSSGQLDFLNGVDNSYKDEILTRDGQPRPDIARRFQVLTQPQLNTEYLGFQTDPQTGVVPAPLRDVRVRRALGLAIDRAALVRHLLNGVGTPATAGFIPLGLPGFDSAAVHGFGYQPDSARQLLAAAGYPGGKGVGPLTLYTTNNYAALGEFVQRAWQDLGLEVQLQFLQGGALRKQAYGGQIALWRASWIADYPDAENYLSLFYGPNAAPAGPNNTRHRDPAYDTLFTRARAETAPARRLQFYQQMDRLLLAHAPIIPLYYDRSVRLLQPTVQGLPGNAMNLLVLKGVRL